MPLIKSSSKKAVGENIKKEESAGKPHKQSIAIALSVQRAAKKGKKKMAKGGLAEKGRNEIASQEGFEDTRPHGIEKGAHVNFDKGGKVTPTPAPLTVPDEGAGGNSTPLGPQGEKNPANPVFKPIGGKAHGGEINPKLAESRKENHGTPAGHMSDVKEHYASIADAILAKKRMAEGGQVDLAETNAEAAEHSAMSASLEDLDELAVDQEKDDEESTLNSVADRVRHKMKGKRGL